MKPKFTPDPIHEGASKEEILSWAQRQFERIEDWWPKDLSDRVEELESRNPQQTGTWPIVDSSSVSFGNVTAGQTELTCALAWWPVEPGTAPTIEDIGSNGLDLTVFGPDPVTEANYLSTDVSGETSSTRSFDGTFPFQNSGNQYWAANTTAYDISFLIEDDCAIQFYVKRQNVIYDDPGEQWLFGGYGTADLDPPGWGGWGIRTNATGGLSGPAALRFMVGLTDGRIEFKTDANVIANNTWYKVRIEWTASTKSCVFKVDDNIVSSSVNLQTGTGTPQGRDLTNTSPTATNLGVFVCSNNSSRNSDGLNGFIDDIRLSTCINV